MGTRGFSLLELMVTMAVLGVVSIVLFTSASNLGAVAEGQDALIVSQDNARNAMMLIVREIQNAARSSIDPGTLPGASLSYRKAEDIDGNGTAVDAGGFLELGPVHTIGRDSDDANNDGLRDRQLVVTAGNEVRVLANNLLPSADGNGIWFEQWGPGIRVTLQIEQQPSPRSARVRSTLSEIVIPRN